MENMDLATIFISGKLHGKHQLLPCFNVHDPKIMFFWESKHKGKDFVKSTNKKLVLFYFYVQESIAHNNIAHIRSKR